jgi:antitoxin MazE
MQTAVARWGNSLALRIPKSMATSVALTEGTSVELRIEDGSLVVTPSQPRFRLSDLLKDYDPAKHRHGEADTGAPVGEEAW